MRMAESDVTVEIFPGIEGGEHAPFRR